MMQLDDVTISSYDNNSRSHTDNSNMLSQRIRYSSDTDKFDSGNTDLDYLSPHSSGDRNYRTMMWAALATLVALLLVICVIFLLVWRYFRKRLRAFKHHHLEADGDGVILPEEMPLQQEDSCDTDFRPSELEKSTNNTCTSSFTESTNNCENMNCFDRQEGLPELHKDTNRLMTNQC